ncbi:MAG TPA: helix-turn-helix domain-containing protein [Roseiarcus sp.]|nr:helix-turn-helix domain-containing protein [Roseiarcus sp.]
MRIQSQARARRRRYPASRIKQSCCYEPAEIAKLFGVHRNTVRHWLKDGLQPIDCRRPILVHGSKLKAFLARRQEGRRQKCAPGQFYCFKCRAPRTPWENLMDVAPHTEKVAKLTAICGVCETRMHRTIRRSDLPRFTAAIEQASMASERLIGCPDPIQNCHLEKAKHDVETEPAE